MLLIYLLAGTMLIQLPLVGELMGSDVFCAGLLVYSASQGRLFPINPAQRQFDVFILLWFAGLVASDIYQGTPFLQLARGWANVAFFAIDFMAIRIVVGDDIKKAVTLVSLLFLVSALKLAFGIEYQRYAVGGVFGEAWKFGYGHLLSIALFLLSAFLMVERPTRPIGRVLPFASAAVALLCDARSIFGMTALAAAAAAAVVGRRRHVTRKTLAWFAAAGALAGLALVSVYAYTASHGLLGTKAFYKYASQSLGSDNVVGLIAGGRSESFASIQAIIDSPIIGHGSWARDYKYVFVRLIGMQAEGMSTKGVGFDMSAVRDVALIPTHSEILGAWVNAGILGAIFWLWALRVIFRGGITALTRPTPLTGFYLFICLNLAWDLFFSPLGADQRTITSGQLYLMMVLAATPAESTSPPEPVARREARPFQGFEPTGDLPSTKGADLG